MLFISIQTSILHVIVYRLKSRYKLFKAVQKTESFQFCISLVNSYNFLKTSASLVLKMYYNINLITQGILNRFLVD